MSQSGRYLASGELNPIDTLTGNTGGPVGPTAGNINVVGTGAITVTGNPATSTLTISSTGAGITITGDSGGALGPSTSFTFTGGSTGLTFSGAGTTETVVGTLNVAHGGTGDTSFTTYAPIVGGTTTTGALQSASTGQSNVGYVLTSTGSGSLPTWQATAPSGVINIAGDSGTATGSTITFNAHSQAGSTFNFSASGSTVSFNVSDGNGTMILGNGSGVASPGSQNTILGAVSGNALLNTSSNNTSVGCNSVKGLTSGVNNCALGQSALQAVTTGSYNCAFGVGAGNSYTGSESSNILINHNGVASESHTLRIGGGTGTGITQLSKAFICGIDGVNVGSVAKVLTMASDQIGTATITAGTGISVTPGANTITIASSGTTTLTYTSVNHAASPYTVLSTDQYIGADVTAGVISILLPNAPSTGRTYTVKDKVGLAATSNITVTTVGGVVTIDGSTSFVMNTAYESANFLFNGTSYEVW